MTKHHNGSFDRQEREPGDQWLAGWYELDTLYPRVVPTTPQVGLVLAHLNSALREAQAKDSDPWKGQRHRSESDPASLIPEVSVVGITAILDDPELLRVYASTRVRDTVIADSLTDLGLTPPLCPRDGYSPE